MLRRDGLRMRPDWEVVTSQVLDYHVSYEEANSDLCLDLDRIAVIGSSMGRYYSLCSAKDVRFKACISNHPFYDMWDMAMTRMPALATGCSTPSWDCCRKLVSS